MKKLMMACVTAVAAAVCGAADAVRYSTDDGATWTGVADFDAALAAVTAGAGAKNIIEIDADTTWSAEHTLTDKDLTIRSSEELCVLKVAAAAAKLKVVGGSGADRTVRFENLILDGGAVWTDPDVPSSTGNSGVSCGQLVRADNNGVSGSTYIYIELGDGFTLRNCQMTDDVFYGYVRSVFRLQDGACIENCRGTNFVVNSAAGSGGLCIDGGVVSNNFTSGSGLLKACGNDLSRNYMKGGLITGNRMSTATSPALLLTLNPFGFSGSPVVSGNWYVQSGVDKWELNVRTESGTKGWIAQDGHLTSLAKIGITLKGDGSDGKVGELFGVCKNGSYSGQKGFYFSQNPVQVDIGGTLVSTNLVGSLDATGTKLVWKIAEPVVMRPISAAEVTGVMSGYAYTGDPIEPEPVVMYGSSLLSRDIDYMVAYRDNVNVGTAKIILTGIGDYEGTLEITFKIGNFVRYSMDAGASWTAVGDFDAALAAVRDGEGADNIIELDEDAVWTAGVQLTGKNLTIRTNPSRDGRCVLQVASTTAIVNMTGNATSDCVCRFENMIVDGGAIWMSPGTLSSLDNGGIACGELFYGSNNGISGSSYVICQIGKGATFRNCVTTSNKSLTGSMGMLSGYVRTIIEIEDGAVITDCRGNGAVAGNGAGSGGVRMSGGLVTRCYSSKSSVIYCFQNNPQRGVFSGGEIVGNEVGNTSYAAVYLSGESTTRFTGSVVITGNVCKVSGVEIAHNVRPVNGKTDRVELYGTLEPTAQIGVTLAANGTGCGVGDKFGVRDRSAPVRGARAFFYDGNPELRGKVTASGLIWQIPQGLMLLIK